MNHRQFVRLAGCATAARARLIRFETNLGLVGCVGSAARGSLQPSGSPHYPSSEDCPRRSGQGSLLTLIRGCEHQTLRGRDAQSIRFRPDKAWGSDSKTVDCHLKWERYYEYGLRVSFSVSDLPENEGETQVRASRY